MTKTMCGSDYWTDHRLVVSKLNLHGDHKTTCLLAETRRQEASLLQCSRLDAMELRSNGPEENWTVFRDIVQSSAMDYRGSVSRKHQDCFDENAENIQGLLQEKHLTLVIPAQYPKSRHIQIYARQSRLGSEICKTPG